MVADQLSQTASQHRGRAVPALGAVVLAASITAVVWLFGAEVDSYLTNPVGSLALAGSGTAIVVLAGRRFALGDRTGGGWLLTLAGSVAGYLVLGALATGTMDAAAIAIWSVWWAVPLVVAQLAALAAAQSPRWWSVTYGVVAAGTVALGTILAEPSDPFAGHAPLAPGAFAASPLLDALVIVLLATTVVVPIALAVGRTQPALVAVAAMPPLLILACFGLTIVREPGAVEPGIGSVAYLVALSLGCALAALGLALVRPTIGAAAARRFVALVIAAYAVVLLVYAATLLGAALVPAGPLVSGLAIAALTLAVAGGWWVLVSRLLRRPEPVPTIVRLPLLSPREREVLALLADGVRDAEIASRLHLSERTVESHLTRIFAKLGLDGAEGRNRRVLAVRAWAEAAE